MLYQEGEHKVKDALDVRKIVRTYNEVNLLKHLLFRRQGRLLFRLQRQNLLEFQDSSNQSESSENDKLDFIKQSKDK